MISQDIILNKISKPLVQVIGRRFLSKTSQSPEPEPKHYRLWAVPGDFVYRKEILARQHRIRWHPGLNAGIDDDRSIYALCDGIMIITEDKFEPDWNHPLVDLVYARDGQRLAPQYKRYLHVIPKRRISEFKLIDVV